MLFITFLYTYQTFVKVKSVFLIDDGDISKGKA